MDPIKNSFNKVKKDIDALKQEISSLNQKVEKSREQMLDICNIIKNLSQKTKDLAKKQDSTHKEINKALSTHLSTHDDLFNALKAQILPISTRNRGVPTDRQTDRQTHKQTQNKEKKPQKIFDGQSSQSTLQNPFENQPNKEPKQNNPLNNPLNNTVDNAAEILDSLDNLKKEIRIKFKRLTSQEFTIFSTIYQLDEEFGHTDYRTVANKLDLSESSIRDYVGRIIKKGIPVEKKRVNNKSIQLSISNNLKKVASLPTIMKLRDI
ncbi:hypothetical protein GF378_02670 [Candidatus Pacearchaeota archaeon]|nr:hypothetical protein [Candidatus Pacearchaeota archaeon]